MPPPQNYFHWTPTYSPSFKLAESMDSDESSMESVSSSSPSFLETLSSPSVISSEYISPLPASSDDNYNLSSTVSHLMSSLLSSTLPPTPSPSSPSSSSSISSVSSSDSSSASPFIATATSLPSSSSLPPTTATSTIFTSSTGYPSLIPTITTRDLDFGDRFLLEEQRCVRLVPETYDPIISSLCGLIALIGLIYILCGYRLFRSALFLTGFLVSSSLVYTIILTTETPIPLYGTLIVTLSTGLLIGLVTFLVAWVGLFLLGFNLGTLLGILIILSIHFVSPHVDTLSPPQSIWITFSMIGGWGIIGAFSALYFQKGCTILATCMFGSTFVIAGLDYFVESFNLFLWFWENLKADGSGVWGIGAGGGVGASSPDGPGQFLCLISWILIMLWVILVALGLFCQWCATGRGYYHSGSSAHASSSRRNGTLDLVKIRAEESKTEQKQRKYRYLYQVRTAHGDVISQHYIQSFQKKLSPPMDHHHDSLRTYNSDLSHLTSYNQSESRTTTMSHLP